MTNANCKWRIGTGMVIAWALVLAENAAFSALPAYYDVRTYGAVGDGRTRATAAIQKAVDACAAAGGGKVVIPAGRYVILRLAASEPNGDAPVVSFKEVSGAFVHECTVAAGSGVFLKLGGNDNSSVNCEGNRLAAGIKEREP